MKSLFLTCAFLFTAAFSFAGVETNETVTNDDGRFACIPATLSCGITGVACGDTLADIIDVVLAADDILC